MDNKETRRLNLLWLRQKAKQAGDGRWATLAEKYGTSDQYLMQVVSEKTVAFMGDAVARQIESAEHEPKGWMDSPHFDNDGETEDDVAKLLPADEQRLINRYRFLNESGRHELMGFLAYLKSRTASVDKEKLKEFESNTLHEAVDEYMSNSNGE